jgi:hypothetical protein
VPLIGAGEGDEPAIREEAEAVRDRWSVAAQEGPPPLRQVAQGRAHPAPAPRPQAEAQGAPGTQPVHPHPRQEPWYASRPFLALFTGVVEVIG